MTLTKVLKPVIAKADKAILVGKDQAANLTQFDLLNDLILFSILSNALSFPRE
jgi:hypothetical protein